MLTQINQTRSMFFHTMKANYLQENPEQVSPAETPLKITLEFHKLITEIYQLAIQIIGLDNTFLTNYLCKFFREENQELALSVQSFRATLAAKNFKTFQINTCLGCWFQDENSPLLQLIEIWCPYAHQEAKLVENVHTFMLRQIERFVQFTTALLQGLYPQLEKPKIKTWFQFKLLNRISKNTFFKQIMKQYINKFDKDKGHNAEFTHSQIFESVRELEELVNFPHICEPFNRSIQHMILFYKEHRLKQKITILIKAMNEAREEIKEYREQFKLGTAAVGSDQICPVVNFICQQTGYNILAAVSYVNAFLGQNLERRQRLLGEVSPEAFYCIQVVEALSGVYCHASQFLKC